MDRVMDGRTDKVDGEKVKNGGYLPMHAKTQEGWSVLSDMPPIYPVTEINSRAAGWV